MSVYSESRLVAAPTSDPGIDEKSFRRIASILHGECGIVLADSKKSLAVSRLSRRLRQLKLKGFGPYCDLLESPAGEAERQEMIVLLTTNVTQFFRENHHFDALKDGILPDLAEKARRGDRIRIWSAGCSSGQEPYSIAIAVLEAISDVSKYDFRILATDIDRNMVRTGREGIYRDLEESHIAKDRRNRFFQAVDRMSGTWRVSQALKDLVTFEELNLIGQWPMKGTFDVIFCRNVVIYFDGETQSKLWSRFAKMLKPDGNLFVGHSERVSGPASSELGLVGTTHYKKT